MMTDIGRSHLIPSQKQAFLCCAKCCDTNSSEPQGLQDWCVRICGCPGLQTLLPALRCCFFLLLCAGAHCASRLTRHVSWPL